MKALKTFAYIEIEDVFPKGVIPLNDSFAIEISYNKKSLSCLFPIETYFPFVFDGVAITVEFTVTVSKGPMAMFKGGFEIDRLVLLNREVSVIRSFAMTENKNNTKLVKAFASLKESIKCVVKVRIAYSNKENELLIKFFKSKYKKTNRSLLDLSKDSTANLRVPIANDNDTSSVLDPIFASNEEDNLEEESIFQQFSLLNNELANCITNFTNLPCPKFSSALAEKFFKLHSKYFTLFNEYSSQYHKMRKQSNIYNERYRQYTKMLSKLKYSMKQYDERLEFRKLINKRDKSSIATQQSILGSQLRFFECLFDGVMTKEKKIREKEKKDAEISLSGVVDKSLSTQPIQLLQPLQQSSDTDVTDIKKDLKIIKAVLENLNKKPELLTKLSEKKFCLLKSSAANLGVRIEIPAEWIIDKIDEVPEQSILTSEKDDLI